MPDTSPLELATGAHKHFVQTMWKPYGRTGTPKYCRVSVKPILSPSGLAVQDGIPELFLNDTLLIDPDNEEIQLEMWFTSAKYLRQSVRGWPSEEVTKKSLSTVITIARFGVMRFLQTLEDNIEVMEEYAADCGEEEANIALALYRRNAPLAALARATIPEAQNLIQQYSIKP
ncbi:hypothetical protein CMO91_04880 [Candidatus Woesearchaeota archaeon]|nr:hypothetical protein [Candidatus Woesearchaeota archaeon]|tara:strand:+ start:745 stop:1263 length:519 start_codon:yes stop_codon:yes gene_type:complete